MTGHGDDKPYEVGYGKPPKHTRFKKGESGNKAGYRKGVKNFATDLQEELNARISITENGKRKKISKQKAGAKHLANKVAVGDLKAIPVALNEIRSCGTAAGVSSTQVELFSHEDELVMGSIIKRILECNAAAQSTTVSEPNKKISSDPDDKDNAS